MAFGLSTTASAKGAGFVRQLAGTKTVMVFVHGIFGDEQSTRESPNGVYFPKLVSEDPQFDGVDIYKYAYPTSFLKGPFSIDEIAENMRLLFDVDGVSSYENIIFVAHSMGGLTTRAYLLKNRNVAEKTRFIYFFSTPTTGSDIASIASFVSSNPQLALMQPMRSADYLADLQRQWLAAEFHIPSYCAYETQPTLGAMVVKQISSSNLCTKRLDPIDANHISIVKPQSSRDVPFLVLKSAFRETITAPMLQAPTGVLKKSSRSLSPDEIEQARGRYLPYGDVYVAFVFLDVTNRDQAFPYLDMLGTFEQQTTSLLTSAGKEEISSRLSGCKAELQTMSCLLVVSFGKKPAAGSVLHINIGPLKAVAEIDDLTFRWDKRKFWDRDDLSLSISELALVVQKVDWLVLTSAELLAGSDDVSILRFGITNLTPRTSSLKMIHIVASKKRLHRVCTLGPPDGRPTTVSLRWNMIVSGAPGGVSVDLAGVDIRVMAESNYFQKCSDVFSVSAHVPMDEAIEANSSRQILLRVKEWPWQSPEESWAMMYDDPSSGPAVPLRLSGWPSVSIAVSSEEFLPVLPAKVSVKGHASLQ
ncbi:alpha/beta hydrolase [Bradyrhizobium sp. S3.5.5]|uniref:esterase/lipase family protein n=1 Tax=Bradyrhizobium sp. S3.5.5 TaxID=3156430 RepID=UPI00339B436D